MTKRTDTAAAAAPEGTPVLLEDPVDDVLMRMLTELAAQVWIERERRLVLEAALAAGAGADPARLAAFEPDAELELRLRSARNRFVADVFEPLRSLARQAR